MNAFKDQDKFDKEFAKYMPMYVAGDLGSMTFGEFYSRQAMTAEDRKIELAVQADMDRITGWKVGS